MMSRLGTAVTAAMCFGMCLLCLSCIKNPAEEEGNPVTPSAEYTLNISLNPVSGGSVERKPDKSAYKAGEAVSVTATAYAGYRFVSWTGALVSTNNPITITINKANLNLAANFEQTAVPPAAPVTITFNPNGGTVSPTSAKTGADGKLASLPTPTRDGYTFNWWFTEAAGGAAVTTSTIFNTDAVIYAQWTTAPVTPPSGSTFIDSRDNKIYKKVTIGNQTWMAENLNYDIPGVPSDVCYNNDASYCEKLGRLYNWSNAMNNVSSSSENPSGVQGVCPAGWHLPSVAEWAALINYVGSFAGERLRSKTGWNTSTVVGTDEFGFGALPGGRIGGSNSYDAGSDGNWWSTTAYNATNAYRYRMNYGSRDVSRDHLEIGNLYSVRCVAD